MLILLGLLTASVLISLPFLVWGLHRRVEMSLVILARLEERTTRIEQQLENIYASAIQPAETLDR